MPKRKERSSEEWYRGKVRELESLVRSLKKQLRQYEKYSQEEVATDCEDTVPIIKPVIMKCEECGKGNLNTFELLGRVFIECSVCDFRKKING